MQRFRNLLATLPPGFLKSRLLVAYVPWIAEERAKGERRWAKLYQGRPAPATGAMVKLADLRFWRHDADPPVAASPKECYQGPAVVLPRQMDAIVIVVVGCKGAKLFLLESWVKRAGFPEVQAKVRELSAKYPGAKKLIESAAGAALVASLEEEISGAMEGSQQGDHRYPPASRTRSPDPVPLSQGVRAGTEGTQGG
ncbi:MAG: hypothetical protein KIT31_21210 [Deltaproteobacteria bacterium]|nr:hypothetical protein [Deltaproteobacteria bacterium]